MQYPARLPPNMSKSYPRMLTPCHMFPHTPVPLRPLLTLPDHTLPSSVHRAKTTTWMVLPGNEAQAGAFHPLPKLLQLLGDLSACPALMRWLFCLLQKFFLQPSSECTSPDSSLFHSHFPMNFFLALARQATCKSMQRTSSHGEKAFCARWGKLAFF